MRINKCTFCEEYERTVAVGEIEKQHGYTLILRVCLFAYSKTAAGKEHYTKTCAPMKLRYCPSCGKKLAK